MNKVINYWEADNTKLERGVDIITLFVELKNHVGIEAATEYIGTVTKEAMEDVDYTILIRASMENPTIAARLLANQRIMRAGSNYHGLQRHNEVEGGYIIKLLRLEVPKITMQDFLHLHPVKQAVLEVFWQHGELGPAEAATLVNREGYDLGKLSKLMPNYAKGLLPRMVVEGLLEKVEEGLYVAAKLI